MNEKTRKMYAQLRRKGYPAINAISRARTVTEFESRDDVRLQIIPDELCSMDDLKGDMFSPTVNTDIPRSRLEREEEEFEQRVKDDGVYGIVGEYKCPCCDIWVQADSCWGFVGDDWKESGYDADIMAATMDASKKHSH